jgi:hypothetical protein
VFQNVRKKPNITRVKLRFVQKKIFLVMICCHLEKNVNMIFFLPIHVSNGGIEPLASIPPEGFELH